MPSENNTDLNKHQNKQHYSIKNMKTEIKPKNERNAGRKKHFAEDVRNLQIKVPKSKYYEILLKFREILKPYRK